MKASPSYLLESLSGNDVTFFIPPYQRNYEWSVGTCRVFLSDVKKVASANASNAHTEHFFGSIVYVVEASGFGVPNRYVLTDGQQRVTTTMLFLMALRDSLHDAEYKRAIQKQYLENDRADESTEYKIKLKQVETDWEAYKLLALGQKVPADLRTSAVHQNYTFFRKELDGSSDAEIKELLEYGLTKLSIISIQLEPDRNPWENPQEVFESMNSLGKPLSLADLVRNYLLMGKSSREQTVLYNNYWLKLEKRLPGKLSEFLRDWLQADQHRSYKVARESNFKELYSSFKEVVRGRSIEGLFESFVSFSHSYAIVCGLEKTGLLELNQLISDLNIIGVAPAYSYLSEVLVAWEDGSLNDGQVVSILAGIRTYLLRRRVLGVTTAENKFYPILGSRLSELSGSENVFETLCAQLSSYEYALRLPNDDEVVSRFQTMNFYNLGRSRNYPRLLLSIAEECLTKSRPIWEDARLQLEHIMPQTLNRDWRIMLGEDAESIHQEYVNNIGNITLIRHNQELSNNSFESKKRIYAGQSGLQVTQNYILDQDRWDSEAIQNRQKYIINLLISKVIGIPSRFKNSSNWKQRDSSATQFDSRSTMSQLIGEIIEYISNPLVKAEVVSSTKVLFEGAEWSLGPLTKELKERSGESISKTSSFHGAYYWTWDDVKLNEIDI